MTAAEAKSESEQSTVLVVDDDNFVRSTVADFLRECGFVVMEAANADEAISAFSGGDFGIDVLFTDVQMPGAIDGLALARWVRANRPAVKILIASGATRTADDANNLYGDSPFLAKPYKSAEIEHCIMQLLARGDPASSQ